MKKFEVSREYAELMIGQRVWKNKPKSKSEPKPFKSGLKVNTVKGVIQHPFIDCLAFTFEEDDSFVAVHICFFAPIP